MSRSLEDVKMPYKENGQWPPHTPVVVPFSAPEEQSVLPIPVNTASTILLRHFLSFLVPLEDDRRGLSALETH